MTAGTWAKVQSLEEEEPSPVSRTIRSTVTPMAGQEDPHHWNLSWWDDIRGDNSYRQTMKETPSEQAFPQLLQRKYEKSVRNGSLKSYWKRRHDDEELAEDVQDAVKQCGKRIVQSSLLKIHDTFNTIDELVNAKGDKRSAI
ncbi:hypothetical protein BGZ94_010105 [Podila epigama]|nr:hypothetical protein BGZ94_010105 [Podila epigama]